MTKLGERIKFQETYDLPRLNEEIENLYRPIIAKEFN